MNQVLEKNQIIPNYVIHHLTFLINPVSLGIPNSVNDGIQCIKGDIGSPRSGFVKFSDFLRPIS